MVDWFLVRLDLARTPEAPEGSSRHGYLLRVPLDDEGVIDGPAVAERPDRTSVCRYAPDEPDERKAAVEGSRNRGAKRDRDGPALFFEVQLRADRPSQRCMRLGWRVEPWGPNPVDRADFGGKFPSGTIDVIYGAHHDEAVGALQLWVPDDHIREDAETFRIVLLDPVTRSPLGGTIGAFDPETGMRARRRTPQSLGMENRLVMTVLDAAAQRPRKSSR